MYVCMYVCMCVFVYVDTYVDYRTIALTLIVGKYFDNSAPSEVSANARDDALALQLWQESERLTGIKYNLL
jgi:hypothetical protein